MIGTTDDRMERSLVVLPNWYGEVLFATPFLRGLRTHWPGDEIVALGWPRVREVLAHNPCVTSIMEYDERSRHRSLRAKWRLVQEIRAWGFRRAFILRHSLSRSLMAALAGIPERIGWRHPKSGWCLTRQVWPPVMPRHKSATYLPLLEAVGAVPSPGTYEYWVSDNERRWAQDWWAGQGIDPGMTVILHPGANWTHKQWALERFAAVGDYLAQRAGVRVAISGSPEDVGQAQAIARQMREPSTLLAGRTTLRQLAACLERVALLIAGDTGVLHLAAALHRPVVALYGPTSPSLTGPLGDPSRVRVIHRPGDCSRIPCTDLRSNHAGMAAITVEEVVAAAEHLMPSIVPHPG